MNNHLQVQYSQLLSLPPAQRLPSIKATIRALPQSRTRVEVLSSLVLGLPNASKSKREVRAVEDLFWKECGEFLVQNESVVQVLQYGDGDHHWLAPTIITMSNVLIHLPEHRLSRIPTSSLAKHLLLAISQSMTSCPSALPTLTRLLDKLVASLPPSPALHILVDSTSQLTSYISRAAGALPPSSEDRLPLLLTFTSLSLTVLTSLLTHARPSPSDAPRIAAGVLRDMSVFADTIWEQYGGIQGTFVQLRRTFYGAVHVLATDSERADELIKDLVGELGAEPGPSSGSAVGGQQAYLFTLAETLLPALPRSLVYDTLLPLCMPSLDDVTSRGTFESAHSLFLGILALPASQTQVRSERAAPALEVSNYVPYYVNCLLQNASTTHLSTTQFTVAYTSLVRTSASLPIVPVPSTSAAGGENEPVSGTVLAWYCVQSLISELRALSLSPPSETTKPYKQALQDTLIALIPAVPLSLLPATLDNVEAYVLQPDDAMGEQERASADVDVDVRQRVWDAVRAVGDEGRGEAMRWWLEVMAKSRSARAHTMTEQTDIGLRARL